MRRMFIFVPTILMLSVVASFCGCRESQEIVPHKIMIDDGWKFIRVEAGQDTSAYMEADFNDDSWETVTIPHSARLESLPVHDQWQGECWYRRRIGVPHEEGQKVYLTLEAAMNIADIWINGRYATKHYGGYLPVVVDITPFLSGNDNVLSLRLDNTDSPVTGPLPLDKLDFNMYGGLYRNAYITVKDGLHITDAINENKPASGGVRAICLRADSLAGRLRVYTHVRNDRPEKTSFHIIWELYREDMKILEELSQKIELAPGEDTEVGATLDVDRPALWSHETPELYEFRTSIVSDGKEIDREILNVGFRSVKFRENKLYINGFETFLRGVNRHQEYPYTGYALSDNAQRRDAWLIKQAGFDYVRTSHYPPSPAFLAACDLYGIWVLDAIPGWQYFNDSPEFIENSIRTSRDMIRRDRNHPCVLAWEISLNETDMPEMFMIRVNATAKEEDPSRPTAGWKPAEYDIYLQARQHRQRGETYDKPVAVSEYGDWEYYAQNAGLNQYDWQNLKEEERTSRQLIEYGEKRLLQQTLNIQEAHNDNIGIPAFADSYWVMFDYNRGYAPDLESSGVMSIFREAKFSLYFFKSQREGEPVLKIASYWNELSSKDVKVFSNCDEVELFLNGRSINRQGPCRDKMSQNLVHPPFVFSVPEFESGELKAIGFIDGKRVAEEKVMTAGDPVRLQAEVMINGTAPGENDILIVRAEVVDEKGNVCRGYDGEVGFTLEGDAVLIGDNPSKIKGGVANVLLRTAPYNGKFTLKADSEGILPAVFTKSY